MRELKINGKIYVLKFTHKAAKCQKCVQKVFELLTGASVMRGMDNREEPTLAGMLTGVAYQVGEIPSLCDTLMYAGLKAENPVDTEEEAGDLLISYMEETGKDYAEIFESLKECMEEDGFFKISGIDQMIQSMNEAMEKEDPEEKTEVQKKPKTTAKKTSK